MENISSMDVIQTLFEEAIAEYMENGLNAELDDELGYSKYDYKNTLSILAVFAAMICLVGGTIFRKEEEEKNTASV